MLVKVGMINIDVFEYRKYVLKMIVRVFYL